MIVDLLCFSVMTSMSGDAVQLMKRMDGVPGITLQHVSRFNSHDKFFCVLRR